MSGIMTNIAAKAIIKELNKIQNLPSKGFLCGGAVANMLLSLLDEKKYPINDIDIFVKDNMESYLKIFIDEEDINEEDIYETPFKNVTDFNIIKTTRFDNINLIFTSHGKPDSPITDSRTIYRDILLSFDINCCQIGIDLETKELFHTDNFLDFVWNRNLICTNPCSPAQTAIRLVKKQLELNARLDKELVFKELSPFFLPNATFKGLTPNLFFGKKAKSMYYEYSNILCRYFTLCSKLEFDVLTSMVIKNPISEIDIMSMKETNLWTLKPIGYESMLLEKNNNTNTNVINGAEVKDLLNQIKNLYNKLETTLQ
jgi:hypothetical protein